MSTSIASQEVLRAGAPEMAMPWTAQSRLAKRMFDFALTVVSLPVVAPLLLVLALVIIIESPGASPLFVQRRLTIRGRTFPLLKLRTMVPDAERRRSEIEHLNEALPPLFKVRNDPRVTRVGRFLRATSLDELPQVLNVLWGHMSVVGPRPRLPHELDPAIPEHARRLSVKPGLAGLWQVSGRAQLQFDEALAIDLRYIDMRTFALDLRLIAQTVLVVLTQKGAY